MEKQTVKLAGDFVKDLLKKGLTADHRYHSLEHTLSTKDACVELANRYRLGPEEMEILELAALFHDTGFTKTYNGHEDVSKEIAGGFLKKQGFAEDKIQLVQGLIETTKVGVEPETLLQKIIKDADFSTADKNYEDKSKALRHEWKVFCGMEMSDREWLENNIQFWGSHQFYTGEAQAMLGEEKRKALKKLRKKIEKMSPKEADTAVVPSSDRLDFSINNSKSAQMMFKTTLRNQIDLTNIADNKANIMLSINSLLITLGIPLLLPKIMEDPRLAFPTAMLLLTCILSIVFATLATRPVKMNGETDLAKIRDGKTNLFFFGNFFKMNMDDYRKGLQAVVQDEDILDKTIVNDLFYLGRALGYKYYRLRITYSIFMTGMIATVLSFGLTYILFK